MTRTPIPLFTPDLSAFARQTAAQLARSPTPPGHVEMLNILARAAGFRNFQHLRAAETARARLDLPTAAPTDHALVERALRHFDSAGVLRQWPAKRGLQVLCLYVLWSRLPSATSLHERHLTALLAPLHGFADPALIRRDMVGLGLLTRSADGRDYRRCETAPPPEARDLIRRVAARPPTA